jgi:hypothetical protein
MVSDLVFMTQPNMIIHSDNPPSSARFPGDRQSSRAIGSLEAKGWQIV